jgi:hypothetical protein
MRHRTACARVTARRVPAMTVMRAHRLRRQSVPAPQHTSDVSYNSPPLIRTGVKDISSPGESTGALEAATSIQGSLVEAVEPQMSQEEDQERAQLMEMAAKYGFSLMPSTVMLQSLGNGIKSRMQQRLGDKVYQMATFSLPYFPKALLETYLPETARSEEGGVSTWLMDTMHKLAAMVPIMEAACDSSCKGLARFFKPKSAPVIRVIALLIPDLEISYTPIDSSVGTVAVNMAYALITESGESHWPKDNQKREIAYDQATVDEVMEQALGDVLAIANAGHPLSPAWWRQLGQEDKAQKVEAALARPRRASAP